MRLNTFLLSSAALMASATVGLAADLPSKKGAPVDYVKVCTIGSFTGFVIPGSDTCLKIGGFVRWQGTYNQPTWSKGSPGNGRAADVLTQAAQASIKFDARTTTEYGLLRSFADFRMPAGGTADVDKAYIQFAGLHAGKVQSLFDFYADDASYGGAGLGSDHSAISIGYTASFGGGFYGVVSLETPTKNGLTYTTNTYAKVWDPNKNAYVGGKYGVDDVVGTSSTNYYGGQRTPDLVAALGVEQSWGKAQLSGAVRQLNTGNVSFVKADGSSVNSSGNEYGYAIQAGVKINMPAVGASDALFLQAAYADGALTYVGTPGWGSGVGHLAGTKYSSQYDFAFDKNGSIKKTKGYNVLAAYEHQWSPTLFSNVFGGVTVYDPKKDAQAGNKSYLAYDNNGLTDGDTGFEARKTTLTQVGANLTWKPVKGLLVAGEVSYANVKLDKGVVYKSINSVGSYKKSDNIVQSLIRIQRDF